MTSSGRSELRILFAFDPKRKAITLLGGDKQKSWNKWYSVAIKVADALFDEYLAQTQIKEKENG
ncbi:MAG: type II toxin-antitoxin system RelE/ParE family toxin [Cellulomonadaceae bacterium]|nr:type II toxin-antitoxin system RelE/ParE family toxin [Cellulomonadaceae bacterium]